VVNLPIRVRRLTEIYHTGLFGEGTSPNVETARDLWLDIDSQSYPGVPGKTCVSPAKKGLKFVKNVLAILGNEGDPSKTV